MFTDSHSLFDVMVKSSTTAEHRLMIDIKDVRDAYEQMKISNVGFVHSHNNLADALTKERPCDALNRILTTGLIDLDVEEWVVRRMPSETSIESPAQKTRECETVETVMV